MIVCLCVCLSAYRKSSYPLIDLLLIDEQLLIWVCLSLQRNISEADTKGIMDQEGEVKKALILNEIIQIKKKNIQDFETLIDQEGQQFNFLNLTEPFEGLSPHIWGEDLNIRVRILKYPAAI